MHFSDKESGVTTYYAQTKPPQGEVTLQIFREHHDSEINDNTSRSKSILDNIVVNNNTWMSCETKFYDKEGTVSFQSFGSNVSSAISVDCSESTLHCINFEETSELTNQFELIITDCFIRGSGDASLTLRVMFKDSLDLWSFCMEFSSICECFTHYNQTSPSVPRPIFHMQHPTHTKLDDKKIDKTLSLDASAMASAMAYARTDIHDISHSLVNTVCKRGQSQASSIRHIRILGKVLKTLGVRNGECMECMSV